MNIEDLNDMEFADVLKQCLIRLQKEDKKVVRVEHDGYNASSIVIPYVDMDVSDMLRINTYLVKGLGEFCVHAEGVEITHHIK